MAALVGELPWFALLREVAEHGVAFAARAVDQPYCEQLVAELGSGPLRRWLQGRCPSSSGTTSDRAS